LPRGAKIATESKLRGLSVTS